MPFSSGKPNEADGSIPKEPVNIAATSLSISPNKLSVTITSNCFGARTSCIPPASAYIWLNSTSGYSLSCTHCTSSRHNIPDSMTFAFSIEQTLLSLFLANSNADRATRRISFVVYLCVFIPTLPPSLSSWIPLGSPKYIPLVNSRTIIISNPATSSFFNDEKSAKASKHCAGLKLENKSNSFLSLRSPRSGLTLKSKLSYFGPPTAPSNTASTFRALATVSSVIGTPNLS